MNSASPPTRTSRVPPDKETIQYIGAGTAPADLEAVEAQFAYTGAMPLELQFFGNQDDQVLLKVIKQLARDWTGKTQARKNERRKITSRVTVVPGLTEIFRALDFAVNDSLDFTDQPTAESWVVEDASEGGYGAVIPAVAGDWVEVGSLIGIEGSSIREWRIGVIRRVNRLEGNQQRVGVELLGGGAQLVTIEQKEMHAETKSTGRSRAESRPESAVLITCNAETEENIEVLVRSGMFTTLHNTEMSLDDKLFQLKPTKVVERSAHAERVAFQMLRVT